MAEQTWIDIILLESNCNKPDCKAVTFNETYNGFFNNYCRMTDRLVQLVVSLAIEISCESCAKILTSRHGDSHYSEILLQSAKA